MDKPVTAQELDDIYERDWIDVDPDTGTITYESIIEKTYPHVILHRLLAIVDHNTIFADGIDYPTWQAIRDEYLTMQAAGR